MHAKYYIWDSEFKCDDHSNYQKADIASLLNYCAAMVRTAANREGKDDEDFYYDLTDALNAEVKRRRKNK